MNRINTLKAAVIVIGVFAAARDLPAQEAPTVDVSRVVEREIAAGQPFVATVMPYKRSVIGSAVDGRVAEFPVEDGDFVRRGQPLAQLLVTTITLEHDAAAAERDLRQAELTELENGSRPEEIQQAEAVMLAAKAAMEYHLKRQQRTESLFARNAVNEDELQLVVSEVVKAQQDYAESRAAYKLAVDGPREERITQARARVAAQQALVDKLKDQIKKHTMISPFDGYVVAEHTEVGQWVKQGDLVAEVVALNEVEVQAYVLENHVPHVRPGMSVRVEVPALPKELFTGTVVAVIPQADLRARTFPVKIRVENTIGEDGPLLKSGMMARAMLATGATQRATLVPKDALVLGGPQPVVFVVEVTSGKARTGQVKAVPVNLGVAEGRLIQVQGELTKDQWVVVRGNERLQPGMAVAVGEVLEPGAEPRARAINSAGQ